MAQNFLYENIFAPDEAPLLFLFLTFSFQCLGLGGEVEFYHDVDN